MPGEAFTSQLNGSKDGIRSQIDGRDQHARNLQLVPASKQSDTGGSLEYYRDLSERYLAQMNKYRTDWRLMQQHLQMTEQNHQQELNEKDDDVERLQEELAASEKKVEYLKAQLDKDRMEHKATQESLFDCQRELRDAKLKNCEWEAEVKAVNNSLQTTRVSNKELAQKNDQLLKQKEELYNELSQLYDAKAQLIKEKQRLQKQCKDYRSDIEQLRAKKSGAKSTTFPRISNLSQQSINIMFANKDSSSSSSNSRGSNSNSANIKREIVNDENQLSSSTSKATNDTMKTMTPQKRRFVQTEENELRSTPLKDIGNQRTQQLRATNSEKMVKTTSLTSTSCISDKAKQEQRQQRARPQMAGGTTTDTNLTSSNQTTTTATKIPAPLDTHHRHGREHLAGDTCMACQNFYANEPLNTTVNGQNITVTAGERIQAHSRHRYQRQQRPLTPPGFWSIEFSPENHLRRN